MEIVDKLQALRLLHPDKPTTTDKDNNVSFADGSPLPDEATMQAALDAEKSKMEAGFIEIEVKAKRDEMWFSGGWLVNGKWFGSDEASRPRYQGLAILSAGRSDATILVPNWGTLDGTKVDMTVGLVKQILAKGLLRESEIYQVYEDHLAAIKSDATHDWSTGWGECYQETVA